MSIVVFEFDRKELLESESFKKDEITIAIDELNETLGFAKCRGIKLEVKEKHKKREALVDLDGFIIRDYTLAHLITDGIVKVRSVPDKVVVK